MPGYPVIPGASIIIPRLVLQHFYVPAAPVYKLHLLYLAVCIVEEILYHNAVSAFYIRQAQVVVFPCHKDVLLTDSLPETDGIRSAALHNGILSVPKVEYISIVTILSVQCIVSCSS